MAVRTTVDNIERTYFINFTCQHWISLFEITNSDDTVYKWFDDLKTKGHYIHGYLTMHNHLHAMIDFVDSENNINTIVSNAKRFMAYEIVKRLQEQNNDEILLKLAVAVTKSDKDKGNRHQVFEPSFV